MTTMATTTFTESQVRSHCHEDSCWVIVNGKVYDITGFLADHPGGDGILLEFAGTDVSSVLGDMSYHSHSEAAYDLLTELYIGDLDKEGQASNMLKDVSEGEKRKFETVKDSRDEEFLDLRKALFPQLWNATYSKAYYLEQVHRPRYTPYCVPYFDNPLLDVLSKTNWFVVPMMWLPFVGYLLYKSWNSSNISTETIALGFSSGVFAWSLLEYVLHRFLFHLDDLLPDHPLALLVHFTLHGIHHHMPMDRLRLVMPPALTILISIPIIKLSHAILYPALAYAFIAGVFLGYICYDMVHYYLHHAQVPEIYFKELKRYHVAHHYKKFDSGFGITSKVWDYVFGTVLTLEDPVTN